jgi:phosphoribosylformylglycinamidine synthase II
LPKTLAIMAKAVKKTATPLYAQFGLSDEEYAKVLKIMGREPNMTELGIFSVMWSEHCSYKSTRFHLKKLPTTAPWVICGPGENAGVIDIGDGQAAIFKMESHNHPSYIEPFQGAATGVGGILRDVFTMGARPVANMNSLRFGSPSHAKTRHLVNGVVKGIGHYGNCVGVPTIGGECTFHESYNGNCLVNAMTVGIAETNKIFYSKAAGIGNPVVYVGAKTGRDGIHGATMASAEFSENAENKRPTVQVGDPFTEKLLIEACMELMQLDAIVAIQDMGAAGLTSSSIEMASKGKLGIEMWLEKVPCRESGMTAYEMMLSESQERMLMILKPGREEMAKAIFDKWDLDFAVIGKLTDSGRMILKMNNKIEADLPIQPLGEEAPLYERPYKTERVSERISPEFIPAPSDYNKTLLQIMASPDLCSKRWIWQQYDHQVMGDTVIFPGGDASLVRVHGTSKGLAITTDCTPRYCMADPVEGGKQAVAETWRNIIATGAKPLAITNCLNFGNPEKPEVMGQIVGCLEGMSEACKALDYPIISGNVSLYNETSGESIYPTPAIGGVGLMTNLDMRRTIAPKAESEVLILIGETKGELGSSIYCRDVCGCGKSAPPQVDLKAERKHGEFVLSINKHITACHDISDGGLIVALAEMAMASGIGINMEKIKTEIPWHAFLFGEDQARYIISTNLPDTVLNLVEAAKIPAMRLGRMEGERLIIDDKVDISVADLKAAHENWLPEFMAV